MIALQSAWQTTIGNSAHASVLIVAVLLLRLAMRRWLPAQCFHLLWLVAAVRLLTPVTPALAWSAFNLLHRAPEAAVAHPVVPLAPLQITVAAPEPPPHSVPESIKAPAQAVIHHQPSLHDWLPILWLSGVFVQALILALSAVRMRNRLRAAAPVQNPPLLRLARKSFAEIGYRGAITLWETEAVSSPSVIGFWRPLLLLPRGLPERLSEEEMRLILLHEGAHLRRRDLATMWLWTWVRALHWFNPLVWLAAEAARADAELACDAAVLRRIHSPGLYGETLLKLAQGFGERIHGIPAVGILRGKAALRGRLKQIGAYTRPGLGRLLASAAAGLAVTIAFAANEEGDRSANPQAPTATKAMPGWANGWKVTRVTVPLNGKMDEGPVDLESPRGRKMSLLPNVLSKEGVMVESVVWTQSPVRLAVTLSYRGEQAEIMANANVVALDSHTDAHIPQIEFDGPIFELPDDVARQLPLLIDALTHQANGPGPRQGAVVTVLTDDQKNAFLGELNEKTGVELLARFRVAVPSGSRGGSLSYPKEIRYPVEWSPPTAQNPQGEPTKFETINAGTDLTEVALAKEGVETVDVEVTPKIIEFLGYVDSVSKRPFSPAKQGPPDPAAEPGRAPSGRYEPALRTREMTGKLSVAPGQTVVLLLGEEVQPAGSPLSAPSGKTCIAVIGVHPFVSLAGGPSLLLSASSPPEAGSGGATAKAGQGQPALATPSAKHAVDSPRVVTEANFIEIGDTQAGQMADLGNALFKKDNLPKLSRLTLVSVMDPPQAAEFLDQIKKAGADVLAVPKMASKSEHQTKVESLHEYHYPTDWEPPGKGELHWTPAAFATAELGDTLAVKSTMKEDGETADLDVSAKHLELSGFVNAETGEPLSQIPEDPAHPSLAKVLDKHVDPGTQADRYRPVFQTSSADLKVSLQLGRSILLNLPAEAPLPFATADHSKRHLILLTVRKVSRDDLVMGGGEPQLVTSAVSNYFPFAVAVQGRDGFVTSPYAPEAGLIDVRGFPDGSLVRCPYTGKMFCVPKPVSP